jgi:hypothetical protein
MLPWASPIEGLLLRLRDLWLGATLRRSAGLRYRSASRTGPGVGKHRRAEALRVGKAAAVDGAASVVSHLPAEPPGKAEGLRQPDRHFLPEECCSQGNGLKRTVQWFSSSQSHGDSCRGFLGDYPHCPETSAEPRVHPEVSAGARRDPEVLGLPRRPEGLSSVSSVFRSLRRPPSTGVVGCRVCGLSRTHPAEARESGPVPEDGTVVLIGYPSSPRGLPRKALRCAVCPERRSTAGSDSAGAGSVGKVSLRPHATEVACGREHLAASRKRVQRALSIPWRAAGWAGWKS